MFRQAQQTAILMENPKKMESSVNIIIVVLESEPILECEFCFIFKGGQYDGCFHILDIWKSRELM